MSTSETENARLFDALTVADEEANARLHARLVAAAERDGVLDVAYRTIATPVGELLLAVTEQGLVRVAYPSQGHDAVLASLAQTVSPRILRAPGRLDLVSRQLDEYFAGQRTAFDLPLDFRLATGFRRADALELFLSGERISSARAAEVGLITRAVPASELDAEVAVVVGRLLAGGPSALAAAKRLVYTIPGMERKAAFARTTELSQSLFASAEAAEGMAAFREKRLPSWAPPAQQ